MNINVLVYERDEYCSDVPPTNLQEFVLFFSDRKIIIHPDGTKTEEMLKEPQPVAVKLDEISKQSLKESKERMKKELEEDYKLFGVEHRTEIDREICSLVALLLFFGVIGVLIYKGGCA